MRSYLAVMSLHLIKLSVGSTGIDSLRKWQAHLRSRYGRTFHTTRMVPKRGPEIIRSDGSIYWVIKGAIRCRQHVLDLAERTDEEGRRCCDIVLSPDLIETEARPQRAFQGWRYLSADKAPPDRSGGADDRENLPVALRKELEDLGLL